MTRIPNGKTLNSKKVFMINVSNRNYALNAKTLLSHLTEKDKKDVLQARNITIKKHGPFHEKETASINRIPIEIEREKQAQLESLEVEILDTTQDPKQLANRLLVNHHLNVDKNYWEMWSTLLREHPDFSLRPTQFKELGITPGDSSSIQSQLKQKIQQIQSQELFRSFSEVRFKTPQQLEIPEKSRYGKNF